VRRYRGVLSHPAGRFSPEPARTALPTSDKLAVNGPQAGWSDVDPREWLANLFG
jgi:hypothetical protein